MRRLIALSKWAGILGVAALTVTASAAAQEPRVVNARIETRSAGGDLAATVHTLAATRESAAWVGYSVPMLAGEQQMCCGEWSGERSDGAGHCGTCRLEGDQNGANVHGGFDDSRKASPAVKLEGPRRLVVVLRIEHRVVGQIRAFSENCQLDAGGLPFVWLGEGKPEQSVALLSSLVVPIEERTHEEHSVADNTIIAIAFHDSPAADHALEGLVAPSQPEWLREKASFWLGVARGHAGYLVLARMAEHDPSEEVRDKVTFALAQSPDPQAVDEMIRMARKDSSPHVRGQSLFWLGQKAGEKAVRAISDAIESDPDTEIKKKAIFALSQLPKDEGVPLLIETAKNNMNSEVRKQAMFWLGQTQDPRALAFFEAVLAR